MGITGLDFQFRFQRLRKREERRAKDRTPLLFWFWEEGLPEDVAFYCTLWSLELGKSSFSSATMHLRKKKKTRILWEGRRESGYWSALATACLCLSWEIKTAREQRVPARHPD